MSLHEKEQANLLRWDGQARGFYEVYYLKFNDPLSQTAAWLRYTLTSPTRGEAKAELWGIFFDSQDPSRHFAIKESLPASALRWECNRFALDLGESNLNQHGSQGLLENKSRRHRLAWDLDFDSDSPLFLHFPFDSMYKTKLPRTKVLSPHLDARFSGTLTADGRRIELAQVPGQQTHIWGTQHAKRWAWGHCNTFAEDPEAVIEALDSQVALGPLTSPPLKIFYLKAFGREFRLNRIQDILFSRSQWDLGTWTFSLRGGDLRVEGRLEVPSEDMLGVGYQDPDGTRLWCNNSKLANCQLEAFDESGRSIGSLHSKRAAAVEFVERLIHPEVPIWI